MTAPRFAELSQLFRDQPLHARYAASAVRCDLCRRKSEANGLPILQSVSCQYEHATKH